jgi:tetratricopeptide (TPR) repeat protein/predicted Ser/Thr protein kinase
MGEVPSGSDTTRVRARDLQVKPTSDNPVGSRPAGVADLTPLPLDPDATMAGDSPYRVEAGTPAAGGEGRARDTVGPAAFVPPSSDHDAATVVALAPGDSGRRTPSPAFAGQGSGSGPGGGASLLETGSVLGGRYEVLELLGEGGMGAVYKAADREVDRIVALKVIRPAMASHPEILARFKQELVLSSKVTHRNVIRIYDLGEAQGVKFITMEYVEGENLRELLKRRGKLEVAEAVDIMKQVASGLAAAHREGIIHRDLKPANIMRDTSGRVVVMDFGLARTFQGDGMTQTGVLMGTIEYMSPEQATVTDVKASSDIFTVGLILYELLAGSTPFKADTAIASLLMRTQHRAPPLVEIDRNIPGSLSNIVARCLDRDPTKRFQSAEELDAGLRAWEVGQGGSRLSITLPRLNTGSMRRLPWVRIGVAGVLVAASAAGGAWYLLGRRQAADSGPHAPVSVLVGDFSNHTGDPVLDNTLEPMLGVALEGASFVNVYSRGDARKLAKKLPNPTDVLDEQASRLVAMNQGVNAVITGDITMRGDEYDISAVALDTVSGKVLAKADVTVANKQEILSELPKLAVPLRKALGDTTPASVQFEKVSGGFTASSLEAVHQDALGVEEQFAGKFQEAFDSFQKAAELDPKFARAYTGMAAMAENLGRHSDALKYMTIAMDHKDRMTEREAYRNQGLYFITMGDWESCVREYTHLVTLYPADRVGQNNISRCYTQLRSAPKALEAAQHAVAIVPRGAGQRLNLAFIEAFASDFSTSEKEARTALEISPGAAQGYLGIAEAQLGQGQLNQAADSYHHLETLGAASTAADGLADLAAYQGRYAEAAAILTQGAAADLAAKSTDSAARKYATLANIEELQGHHAAALAAIGKALAYSKSTPIQFLAARVYVDGGELGKAQKLATGLAAETSSEPQAYGRIIAGLLALKGNDAKAAVTQIAAANHLLDTWIGHFDLGRAYLEAGMFAEARAEFQVCVKRRGEAIELFMDNVPTYAYLPAVYYYQGRAEEGMKDPEYLQSYKVYLSIRGASAGDPLVAEIHKRTGP